MLLNILFFFCDVIFLEKESKKRSMEIRISLIENSTENKVVTYPEERRWTYLPLGSPESIKTRPPPHNPPKFHRQQLRTGLDQSKVDKD